LWVAIGASLKFTPIALVLVYAGRGEWRRAWTTLGLTALLVMPMLLFDLSGYSTESGPRQDSLAAVSPFIFLPVAGIALGAAYLLARTRYGWAAGGLAIILSLPRLLSYESGFLLVGLTEVLRRGRARRASAGTDPIKTSVTS
jgi:hypothetical protein